MTQTANLKETYQEQGFVILRGLYTKGEMEAWKEQANITRESAEGNFGVHVWMLDVMPAYFKQKFCEAPLTEPVQAIYGTPIELLSAKPVFKSGKVREASAWHQDYAYWKGSNKLSVWIAMDNATPDNGCLRVIPGGHRTFIGHEQHGNVGFANRLTEETLPAGEIVDCVMEAGDAIFFHDQLPHCSYPNDSGRERWAMIPTYRSSAEPDDSTTWLSSLKI